jgi:hypothetical protein
MALIPITEISLGFQDPENLMPENVEWIRAAMLRGDPIEQVIVYYDGATYRLFDGFHRVVAAKSIGRATIEAETRLGGVAEMYAEWNRGLTAIKEAMRES